MPVSTVEELAPDFQKERSSPRTRVTFRVPTRAAVAARRDRGEVGRRGLVELRRPCIARITKDDLDEFCVVDRVSRRVRPSNGRERACDRGAVRLDSGFAKINSVPDVFCSRESMSDWKKNVIQQTRQTSRTSGVPAKRVVRHRRGHVDLPVVRNLTYTVRGLTPTISGDSSCCDLPRKP